MPTDKTGEALPEELKSIETALRQFKPLAGQIDRDRLMYLAGQASVTLSARVTPPSTTRFRFGWPLATAALALISVTLGGLLLRSTRSNQGVVYVALPDVNAGGTPATALLPAAGNFSVGISSGSDDANYFQLRNLMLTCGVDALPESPVTRRAFVPRPTPPPSPALWHALLGGES